MNKKLTDEERDEYDQEITEEELEQSLKGSNSGKTPGTDGIEKTFLTRYWDILKNTIHKSTSYFIEKQQMNRYLEKGLIKIIPKNGKDLKVIGDWRPITLLSQIYKLISGVRANRLKNFSQKW